MKRRREQNNTSVACRVLSHNSPYLGDGKHDIGGGDQWVKVSCYLVTYDLWEHHGDCLTQHDGFRLDTANTCRTQSIDCFIWLGYYQVIA